LLIICLFKNLNDGYPYLWHAINHHQIMNIVVVNCIFQQHPPLLLMKVVKSIQLMSLTFYAKVIGMNGHRYRQQTDYIEDYRDYIRLDYMDIHLKDDLKDDLFSITKARALLF
jgi:hypothetical protein